MILHFGTEIKDGHHEIFVQNMSYDLHGIRGEYNAFISAT